MRPLLSTALLFLLFPLLSVVTAQNSIWTYNTEVSQIDGSRYALASNGDLLAPEIRLAPNGDVVWQRSYATPGAILGGMFFSPMVSHGTEMLGLGSFLFGDGLRFIVIRTAQDGSPIAATRIIDPSASGGTHSFYEKVISAPDGGYLVLKGNTYRINADGSLRWAHNYPMSENPWFVTWASDGGFYALVDGGGIVRYTPDGVPVRDMGTLADDYGGAFASTYRHAPVLHNDRLYIGISTVTNLGSDNFRVNTGVVVTDTMGIILNTIMNHELLSPVDNECLYGSVTLAIVGDRLLAGMAQLCVDVGLRNYLLDCDLDLNDARWYALPEGDDHHVDAVFAAPDGRAVLVGAHTEKLMHARLSPGTDLSSCFASRLYSPAPLNLYSSLYSTGPVENIMVTLEPMTVTSAMQSTLSRTTQCTFTGLPEHHPVSWQVTPNPASDMLVITGTTVATGSVQLYDTAGRCVLSTSFKGSHLELPVHGLTSGLYTLHLTDGDQQQNLGRVTVVH